MKAKRCEPGRLRFFCPGCDENHVVVVEGAHRWGWNGSLDEPSLSPSVLVTGKRRITDDEHARIMAGERVDIPESRCHSFVTEGSIQFLPDCTHALAGKTVALPEIEE